MNAWFAHPAHAGHPWYFVAWAMACGLAIGSFLNVVVYRLPLRFRLTLPSRSACRTCRRRLTWSENVPVLSFVFQRARCRGCGSRISGRYPLIELMTASLFVACASRFGASFASAYFSAFLAALVAITFIDLDHRIIPDAISFPGMAAGFAGSFLVPELGPLLSFEGLVFGGLGLWFTAWAYERATGREGLGFGDVKMIAMIGAFLGPHGALGTVLISSIFGSVIGMAVMAAQRLRGEKGHGFKTALPYGPFLAMGSIVWVFWGDRIAMHFLLGG